MNDTKTVSGAIVHFTDADEAPLVKCLVDIVPKQSGSGTPSPDNVRPISGWESVVTSVTGVNVWDEETELGGLIWANGQPLPASDRLRSKNFAPCTPNTRYHIFNARVSSVSIAVFFYDASQAFINYTANIDFTTPSNAHYFKLVIQNTTTHNNDISINYPSTDTEYHAYNPNSHTTTVNLGRTVYGGTLDVVSGVLTVDKGFATFDGSSDEQYTTGSYDMAFRTYLPNDLKPTTNNRELAGLVSNQMTEVTQASTWGTVGTCALIANANQLYFKLADELTDISELRTYLASNPLQIVYPLADPQTYSLTGQEISTLLGENNVWADSGDIEITYHTDTLGIYNKIYINGRPYFRPNDFEVKREDVYAGEYTTCTGKLIADKIGWKYSDLPMKWDILPDEDLVYLTTLTGAFNLIFRDSDGQHTEQVIRKGFTNTPTRITGPEGSKIWTGIEMEVTFLNTHPIDEE